jgi:hypothetical protein
MWGTKGLTSMALSPDGLAAFPAARQMILTLSNEGSSGGDNGLGSRDAHGPEDKSGKFSNEPLDESNVVQGLYQGNED